MKRIISISSLIATVFMSFFVSQTVYADTSIQLSAANACFPRIFSQIDFFKSSNGALKNNSNTPKTIVCSVDIPDPGSDDQYDGEEPSDLLYVFPSFAFNVNLETIPCTLYIRSGSFGDNTLLQASASSSINFESGFLNFNVDRVNLGTDYESYAYFQCTLPAGAAITMINIYNY